MCSRFPQSCPPGLPRLAASNEAANYFGTWWTLSPTPSPTTFPTLATGARRSRASALGTACALQALHRIGRAISAGTTELVLPMYGGGNWTWNCAQNCTVTVCMIDGGSRELTGTLTAAQLNLVCRIRIISLCPLPLLFQH